MKLAITCLLLLSAACQLAICGNGVVRSRPTEQQQYQCYVQNGFTFAAIRAYTKGGSPDTTAAQNVLNAQSANMPTVDLLLYPCPSCSESHSLPLSATKQVEELYEYLNENQVIFNRMWLVVEDWLDSWFPYDQKKNRAFFDELAKASVNKGWNVGVYTDSEPWNKIMGKNFKHGGEFPVWYWGTNSNATFNDWNNFGGWFAPTMKDIIPEFYKCDSRWTKFAYNPNY